jgi:two-component system cell cycle sensor histidine kinase/response regulator CckA
MKILHIEDCAQDAELVKMMLVDEWPDCLIDVVCDRERVVGQLQTTSYDLVLSDFSMGSFTGLDALKLVKSQNPGTPFIFLSGTIGEDRAIEAVRAGAADYVIKDRMKRLVTAIHRAIMDANERKKRELAEQRLREQAELLDRASDAIIVTDLDNNVTFWNHGAEQISGWTFDEAVGRRLDDVLGTGSQIGNEASRKTLDGEDECRSSATRTGSQ